MISLDCYTNGKFASYEGKGVCKHSLRENRGPGAPMGDQNFRKREVKASEF